jgi:ATP-binding cassette, subfamily B, bacterial PglK
VNTIRKVLVLFEPRERWQLFGLLGVIVLMAVVQTVGVASILPFMSLVGNPDAIAENRLLSGLYERFGFTSERSFLLFVGLVVLGITAFSNAFAAVTHWLMVRFVWRKQHQLSVRLLASYLQQPYTFHLNRNSAALTKNIIGEVKEVVNGVIMPGLRMIAQTIVSLFIIGLLFAVDVALAVTSIVVLGGSYGVLYTLVRRKQIRLGRIRAVANAGRFKAANEALGAIKETKVLGREREFVARFSKPARRYANTNASNAVISDIPKYVLETIAFGGILLVVLYILGTREDFGQAVAVMSLYALAGYRLMPALQQIFNGLARVRFFAPALDTLSADLEGGGWLVLMTDGSRTAETNAVGVEREIALERVTFRYPESNETVVREIDLRIPRHTTVGLVGSTGSGKTTLVDIVLGLLQPEAGSLRVDGVEITGAHLPGWRRRLGYVPQHIFLGDDTIAANIALGINTSAVDHQAVERAARIAQLHEFVMTLPRKYDTIVGERGIRLSGGQRQRIGIARALYHDPDVLIMDEATSALDGITEDGVMQAIRALAGGKTIILVAHRITTLRECDVIYMFEQGVIADSGTYPELMKRNAQFRAMASSGRSVALLA